MKLTPVQRDAVLHGENTLLVACPGSGKTRCIVSKLLRCIPDVRDTVYRIGCITYTNAAVHEIEHRLRVLGRMGDEDYCDISTIHAFCLNNILRHFYWRLPEVAQGFEVLAPDSERYKEIVASLQKRFNLGDTAFDAFQRLSRSPDGSPLVVEPLSEHVAEVFWDELAKEGYVDFPSIVYLSYKLLRMHPSIASSLSCHFPWLLIDKFQDTSALQVEIFRLIAAQGHTRFFLVGDPFQSIYGFAEASPELMFTFADEIGAKKDFVLSDNFRSSAHIVKHAECLWARTPEMTAKGENAAFPQTVVYSHVANAFQAITDEFLPLLATHSIPFGQAAILAPQWPKLQNIGRQLRAYGIPIVGPGARPYRRSRVFAQLAEDVCGYIDRRLPEMVAQIEWQLFNLVAQVTGRTNFAIFSYNGRRVVYELIAIGESLAAKDESGANWLREASVAFTKVITDAGHLSASNARVLPDSVADMLSDMQRSKVDIANLTVQDLGLFACPEHNMKLMTMHASKGREFDAVALVDLHDGKIPHFTAKTQKERDEAKRLLYVATTRARKVLLYVTDTEHWRNTPCPFLKELPCCN